MRKNIAVFCSASFNIDPKFNKVAREFVRAASLHGYGIVSGGTVKGTMGEISQELSICGGYHLGVIPRFMEHQVYPDLSEVIWTETMAERKTLMRKDTVAVVALPGGVGTLDEFIETVALVHLERYDGKLLLLDHEGFYRPLKDLLTHYLEMGMMPQTTFDKVIFAPTVDELMKYLEA